MGTQGPMGVRVPPPASRAGVVQLADTPFSEGGFCEFESHLPYQTLVTVRARGPNGRGGSLKKSLGAGSTPAARITRARVAQRGRGGGLKPRRLRVRVSPRASHAGAYANGQSGLSFKQAPSAALRVRAPPPPPDTLTLAVAQRGRAPHCDCGGYGFDSRRPTFRLTHGALAKTAKARDFQSRKRGFESRTPCQLRELWPRGEAHACRA